MQSLKLDTFALLTTTENERFKRRSKFGESTVGSKRESLHPAAQEDLESESLIHQARFPHNQWLRVQDSYMLSMLSRILRVCQVMGRGP